jgi:predicted dehydrogenase
LEDSEVNALFIATGHDSHARLVCQALEAGKHVFVEKPLCLTREELKEIQKCHCQSGAAMHPHLMVGYNRRFSPHIFLIKKLLAGRSEPLTMTMTVNAGEIDSRHWTQDPKRGGGRIIGECCHFIDLMAHLAGALVTHVSAMKVGEGPAVRDDKMSILLGLSDGSLGAVNYFSNGAKSYPKETLEIFCNKRILRMENFRLTRGFGFSAFRRFRSFRQDKGHKNEVAAFIENILAGGKPLIPFEQLANVSEASFAAVESARGRGTIKM